MLRLARRRVTPREGATALSSPPPGSSREPFVIDGQPVDAGTARNLQIPVSQQITGMMAHLAVRVVHGARHGPRVFVSAAIHGDEIVGTAVVQGLAQTLDPATLCGTVILAPAVNIFGLMTHSRYLPDRRDLNRSFPGSARGSLASQLAATFLDNVISPCTFGIDIHTAAIHRYNLPQIRIAAGDSELVELAMVFGAPMILESPLRDGSMRELAHRRGVKMLLLEAGEALRFDRLSIDTGIEGVLRVFRHLGMMGGDDSEEVLHLPARSNRSTWVRAPRGGMTKRIRKSGDAVVTGERLATVSGLFGEDPSDVVAPIDGIVIGHATLPVVNQGDAMFHIAAVDRVDYAERKIGTIKDAILATEPTGPAKPVPDEDEVV